MTGLREFVRELFPAASGSLANIPGTGPAPTLFRVQELHQITSDWERLTNIIESNQRIKKAFGALKNKAHKAISLCDLSYRYEEYCPDCVILFYGKCFSY